MPRVVVRQHLLPFLKQQFQITLAALRHVRGAAARARLRGQLAGLAALPRFLRKRSVIRQQQRLRDSQFLALLGK